MVCSEDRYSRPRIALAITCIAMDIHGRGHGETADRGRFGSDLWQSRRPTTESGPRMWICGLNRRSTMPSSPATVLASNAFRDAVRVAPPVVHLLLAVLSVVVALRPAGRLRRAFLPLGA